MVVKQYWYRYKFRAENLINCTIDSAFEQCILAGNLNIKTQLYYYT